MRIKAVGDICPGDKSIPGLGVLSLCKRHGAAFPFQQLGANLGDAALVIGNLEGPLSRAAEAAGGERLALCGLPAFATELRKTGFNVLTLANNHVLEHGPEVFRETVGYVREAGIAVCGLRSRGSDFYSEPVLLTVRGRTIGLLGYNWVGTDTFPGADELIAQSTDSLVNYTWNRHPAVGQPDDHTGHNKHVIHDLQLLRPLVDVLILLPHWGYEFVNDPPYNVVREAHSFIEAGADLIIGSHPHVLQGVEVHAGKPIIYSLGNFLFDFRRQRLKDTAVLDVSIDEHGVSRVAFQPYVINRNFQPEPAPQGRSTIIHALLSRAGARLRDSNRALLLEDDGLYREYEKHYLRYKLWNILDQCAAVARKPALGRVLFAKVLGAVRLGIGRLRGKRVRW